MKTTRMVAAERSLDQALREQVGGESPPDLRAKVRARAERADWPAGVDASASRWRAAALIAAGIVVAVGTAVLRREVATAPLVPATAPQDPTPAAAPEPEWVTATTVAEVQALDASCRALRLKVWVTEADSSGGLPAQTGVASALNRASKLERLDLDIGDRTDLRLDEADLRRIGEQATLRELRLSARTEVQPEWLAHLAALPLLATVVIPHVAVGDTGAAALARLPSLQSVDLAFDGTLTDAGLASLVAVPGLRSLSLRACGRLTSEGLVGLAACKRLERLDLRFVNGRSPGAPRGLPARFMAQVERMLATELVVGAEVGGGGVDDDVLQALAQIGTLRELLLGGCPSVTPAGLAALGQLPLRQLSLSIRAGEPAAFVDRLPPTLTSLSLAWSGKLGDAAVAALGKRLPQLRELDLAQCPELTAAGLRELLASSSLTTLELRGCTGLTAEVLPALLAGKSLEVLDVSGLRWVDAAVENQLRELPAMRELRNERGGFVMGGPLRK